MKMRTTLHFLLSAFLLILLTPLAVTASDTEPEEITFSTYDFIVYVNEDYDVPLNITPDGADLPEDFLLESTNPDVLAVAGKNTVTGITPGFAKLNLYCGNSYDTCSVTVMDKPEELDEIPAQNILELKLWHLRDNFPEHTEYNNLDFYYNWKTTENGDGQLMVGPWSFAYILSDELFGLSPERKTDDVSILDVRVGDIVFSREHSHLLLVTEVTDTYITGVTSDSGMIEWRVPVSVEELEDGSYTLFTRYPEDYEDESGWGSGDLFEISFDQPCRTVYIGSSEDEPIRTDPEDYPPLSDLELFSAAPYAISYTKNSQDDYVWNTSRPGLAKVFAFAEGGLFKASANYIVIRDPASVTSLPSEQDALDRINYLQPYIPEGSCEVLIPESWTYTWENENNQGFEETEGSLAVSLALQDDIFGRAPAAVKEDFEIADLKSGDILTAYDSGFLVKSINRRKGIMTVVSPGYDGRPFSWKKELSFDEESSEIDGSNDFTLITRYPDSYVPDRSKCGDDITWTLVDGTLTLTGKNSSWTYDDPGLVPWDSMRGAVEHLVVGDGITVLNDKLFLDLENLQDVSLADSVKSFGSFEGCSSLKEIHLPRYLTMLKSKAFCNCSSLERVYIPYKSQYAILRGAFLACWSLTDIYYGGTEAQWKRNFQKSVSAGLLDEYGCPDLEDITIHYNYKPLPFTDVPDSAYYADAVRWAVANEITSGTSPTEFSPQQPCTRGQAVTFLWRAAGSPAPTSQEHSFTDIKTDSYYYNAVLWAVEQGITNGTGKTTFSPNAVCTRGQIVTFLYRLWGSKPAPKTLPFRDIQSGAYYYDPVLWAVENSITSGTSATAFSPGANCTRAQIVTFLYRASQ